MQGVLGDYRSIAHLSQALAPRFLPSSYALAPLASIDNTGNRTVAITNTGNVPQSQQAILQLSAGTVTWSFDPPFPVGSNPVVSITPVGNPPSSGTTVNITAVAYNEVVVTSTSNTDTRVVHLTATVNE